MTPKLGDHLFYTAPEESQLKPGPYPCVVVQPADGGVSIVAFGAGGAAVRLFDVDPKQLSADGNPYKAPAKTKAPPGVSAKAKPARKLK